MFASSRKMVMDEKLRPEDAWNYGINATSDIEAFGMNITLNAEYYRTDFINQAITDMEKSPIEVHFYNLKGKSYSNSFQFDASVNPLAGLTLTAAYRLNDVKMTINGELLDKPLQSRQKGFLNMAYTTMDNDWSFDFTTELNGGGRLPNTGSNPAEFQLGKEFSSFWLLHAQITKKFKGFDIYLGGENLTNFTQSNPILDANNPKDKYFDSSIIWGPIIGRTIYLGIRLTLK